MSGSVLASQIREHMVVVGSDGGPVDKDRIKLTKNDNPDGSSNHHHYLPVSAVASVEDGDVRLDMDADRARKLATISTGSTTTHGMGSMGHRPGRLHQASGVALKPCSPLVPELSA